ncbi:cytochrome c oxidase assembly protein [Pseudonocardia sp. RS010]|uniref:cytochrome c oxidase assembly protein n=1 Tax=Pseudonocardia sp. RS010 TaxID=3385979 RepID=UPI00399FC025
MINPLIQTLPAAPTTDSGPAALAGVLAATIPPPVDMGRVFTSWTLDPWVLVPLVAAGAAYLAGVRTLRRRGIEWRRGRTVLWFVGLSIIALSTSSMIGVYDNALFSMSAVQHMMLQMIAPAPLGLAAPITLALRALSGRPRRILLAVVHSRYVRVVGHPFVAYLLFVVSPFVLIYSPLFELSITNAAVHDLTHLHFVLVGALLYWPLLGVDPLPNPMPWVLRLLLVIGLGPAHIVLGIPIMLRDSLIAPNYFTQVAAAWSTDPLADQKVGGGLLWIFGDVVVLFLLAGMFVQWNRSEKREQRRVDRHLDRRYGAATATSPWWLTDDPRAPRRMPHFVEAANSRPVTSVPAQSDDAAHGAGPAGPASHAAPDTPEPSDAESASTTRTTASTPTASKEHQS